MFSFLINVLTSNITQGSLWSFCYFFPIIYNFFITSVLFYLIPNIKVFIKNETSYSYTLFQFISSSSIKYFIFFPLFTIIFIMFTWSGPTVLIWYNHLIFSNWQYRLSFYLTINFFFILIVYNTILFFTNSDLYDYYITIYNFYLWLFFMFFSNNFFTFIFFIEILSTLIILMITTSTFSSTYFFNQISFTKYSYFQNLSVSSFIKTLIFFFWTSLLASLTLFLFLLLFYLNVVTFDWYFSEIVFTYLLSISDIKTLFTLSMAWLIVIFCFFLKCGVVPFFFWKPNFFKGMSFHSLFFYICFFYFHLLLFLIYYFIVYMNELFYFNNIIHLIVLIIGVVLLTLLLFESYYIKSFLAFSSILNTLLIFLGLTSFHTTDIYFYF